MSIINVCQYYHLGDNIINFIFFYKIKEYIEEHNIIINYYCHKKYHKNLLEFKSSENINICDISNFVCLDTEYFNVMKRFVDNDVEKEIYHLWQATDNIPKTGSIEDILCTMFNLFLKYYNIPITVNAFEYQDNDLLYRYSVLEDNYKNIDILIVNSSPLSEQYIYNKPLWEDFITKLSNRYRIAITEKISVSNENIVCLSDFNVKNIASVAIGVKKIIAINTGPSIPLYNVDILNNIDVFYLFGGAGRFKTRKIQEVYDLKELNFLLLNYMNNYVNNLNIKQKSAYLLSHNGLGDNITMLGAINFLKQYYDKIYFLCKNFNENNIKKMVTDEIILVPFDPNNEFKECANIIKNIDLDSDIFISGFCHTSYLKSRITHPELIKYQKNNKQYTIKYNHIKNFYNDINLDLSIYYDFFDIKSSIESIALFKLIDTYKIVFVHTKASNMEINIDHKLIKYISDSNYIVICANKNMYTKENDLYNIAQKFVNIPIAYYIDVIKNSVELHLIDSCFSCIVIPLKGTNRLLANEIIIYKR